MEPMPDELCDEYSSLDNRVEHNRKHRHRNNIDLKITLVNPEQKTAKVRSWGILMLSSKPHKPSGLVYGLVILHLYV